MIDNAIIRQGMRSANRDTHCAGVRKRGITLIHVSTVMGIGIV